MNNTNKHIGGIVLGGHVQGLDIVRSLGRNDIPVVVMDTDYNIASQSRYCKSFIKCPEFNSEEFVNLLINMGKKNDYNNWVLYPTNDFAAYSISMHRDLLNQFYKFTIPCFSIFTNFYSKKLTVDLCLRNNIPVPKTEILKQIHSTNNKFVYPCIVRGVNGLIFARTFGKKVFKIYNREELERLLMIFRDKQYDIENVMIQEFIPFNKHKRGYYFTSFCVDGEVKTFFMWEKMREHPLKHGTSTWCKSVWIEDIIESSFKLLKSSGFTGVSEIEYLYDERDNSYKFIEVNARTFLQGSLARASGVDYAMIIYNYLNNIDFNYPPNYKIDIHWLHFWTDFFTGLWGVLKRELVIKEYLYPYRIKPKEMAVFSLNDFKPFLWETIMFPYIVYKRLGLFKKLKNIRITE